MKRIVAVSTIYFAVFAACAQNHTVRNASTDAHDNATAIYDAAKRILTVGAKSQFETKAEYDERVARLLTVPLVNGRTASDQFSFVLGQAWPGGNPVPDDDSCCAVLYGAIRTKYDAESKRFTVEIPSQLLSDDEGNFYDWLSQWSRTNVRLGSFVGENGLGIKRTVSRLGINQTDISVEDFDWLNSDCDHQSGDESCTFEVGEQIARSLSHSLRVIVSGSLLPPFTSSQSDVFQPTVQNPAELHSNYRVLYLRLNSLEFVDSATGVIIKSYTREKHAMEYPLVVTVEARVDAPFSDTRCNESASFSSSSPIDIDYSVDGSEQRLAYLDDHELKVEARNFVDISVRYCNIPRIRVLVNGKAQDLECEGQSQFIANNSKCKRIQLTH